MKIGFFYYPEARCLEQLIGRAVEVTTFRQVFPYRSDGALQPALGLPRIPDMFYNQ